MSIQSHLSELQRKHQSLETAVAAAERTRSVDQLEVSRLKKQKLRLKETIERLRRN